MVPLEEALRCSLCWSSRKAALELGLEVGLEEVFVFDSKSENRDRAVESVSEASGLRLGAGAGAGAGRELEARWIVDGEERVLQLK